MRINLARIVLFTFILNAQFLCAQNDNFDIRKLKNEDKQLLSEYWINFKNAVNTKDKVALSSLIKFPLICDYCQEVGSKQLNVKIFKNQFEKKYFEIFLDPKLIKRINNTQDIFSILIETCDATGKKCVLNFGYGSIEPSKISEGRQHFFSLEKIKNKYYITSAWTI